MSKGSWIKGTERDLIFNMLVAGENHKIIGDRTGHSEQVISNWSSHHRIEIAAARQERAVRLEKIWLAVQENRLAKVQDRHVVLTDRFYDLADENDGEEDPTSLMVKVSAQLTSLERQTGEEMGQLQSRMKPEGPLPMPMSWDVEHHDGDDDEA
jgi:hypothetical protein